MNRKKGRLQKPMTLLISLAFFFALVFMVLFVGSNFKKIAVMLHLPFDLPASWYSGETVSGVNSIQASNSSDLPGTAEWFSSYLKWFLLTDFEEFSKVSEMKNDQLIYFGIISAANSEKSGSFSNDEKYNIYIPAGDIHYYAGELLDGSVSITDKTVANFSYNAALKQYTVPSTDITPENMAFITDIKKTGSKLTEITVAYFPYDQLAADKSMPSGNPEKTMVLKLKLDNGTYKITSYLKKST